MNLETKFKNRYNPKKETMSLQEYLDKCKEDPSMYASPAERILKAIGSPVKLDTKKDPRLGRIYGNKIIDVYEEFKDFYGMEEVIQNVVSYFKHSSQGLEERKQILYLLGPVGGGKSSLAEKLKELMEKEPFYAIEDSPINESPLGLFGPEDSEELGIPARALSNCVSPWLTKRLQENGGDIHKLRVVKLYPNKSIQLAVTKTEPGDDNNQDISSLVGKLDIRKLEHFAQDDPDAYKYNGGLCLGNRGVLEFVEMFKAPIKVLHPLLTATQEGNYKATEALSPIPFEGIVLAHSNEAEWKAFVENKNNEAFIDRIYIVKVPYCLRFTEEIEIYKKLLNNSSLSKSPLAPYTLDVLAKFCVMTRLENMDNFDLFRKMEVYNGMDLKDKVSNPKTYTECKDCATNQEGFSGMSTRTAHKIISKVFNFDKEEIGANPVHMMTVITNYIRASDLKQSNAWLSYLEGDIEKEYLDLLNKEINSAYLENSDEFAQHVFDRYIYYAEAWIDDIDYRDPDTNELYNKEELDKELSGIEKPAGIGNPKDFRHEVVNFCLRYRASHKGNNPKWSSYEKLKEVIEHKIFAKTEDLIPVVAYTSHASSEDKKKHDSFNNSMKERGYTQRQTRILTEWFMRHSKSEK